VRGYDWNEKEKGGKKKLGEKKKKKFREV